MRISKLRIARWYALPLSVILTGLHISCCVIPLFSVAILSYSGFTNLTEYKPFFTVFQFVSVLYFGARLVGQRLRFLQFHRQFGASFLSNRFPVIGYWLCDWLPGTF